VRVVLTQAFEDLEHVRQVLLVPLLLQLLEELAELLEELVFLEDDLVYALRELQHLKIGRHSKCAPARGSAGGWRRWAC